MKWQVMKNSPALKWEFLNHPISKFLFKLGILLGMFFLLKSLHNYLIDPSSAFYFDPLKKIDLYLKISDCISYPTKFLLGVMGEQAFVNGRVIYFEGYRGVEIQGPCMGLNIFAIFSALILSFPSIKPLKFKLIFTFIGLAILHFTNILRVAALLIKNKYYPHIDFNHHDVYNFIIYGVVLLLFYYWMTKMSKSRLIHQSI